MNDILNILRGLAESSGDYDFKTNASINVIPTRIMSLDDALGIGGIPRGYITHIAGDSYTGKSVLSWHVAKSVVSSGGVVAIADMDRSTDPKYVESICKHTENLVFIRCKSIFDIHRALTVCAENNIDLFVIDSIASPPEASGFDPADLGRLLDSVSGSNMALILTNQDRHTRNGDAPLYSRILDIIAPITIYLSYKHAIESGGNVTGHETEISILRNRFTGIKDPVQLRLIYGEGFDVVDAMIDPMIRRGSITRKGSWYQIGEEIFFGREQTREAMRRDGFCTDPRPYHILSKR